MNPVFDVLRIIVVAIAISGFLFLLAYAVSFEIKSDTSHALAYQHRIINYLDGQPLSRLETLGEAISSSQTHPVTIEVQATLANGETKTGYYRELVYRAQYPSHAIVKSLNLHEFNRHVVMDGELIPIRIRIIVSSEVPRQTPNEVSR